MAGGSAARVTFVNQRRGTRAAEPSKLRRASGVVLVVGTVLAVVAAFGPIWIVRAGVAVAVVTAIMACVFAYRQLFVVRRQHARDLLIASQRHGEAMHEERTHNASVVEALSLRISQAGEIIQGQRVIIGKLQTQVSSLTGDAVYLRGEIAHRETVIGSLRETVRSREAELIALYSDGEENPGADVHHMPRRVLAEHESAWADVPKTDELWGDGSYPTVVDLKMLETAMVLPNLEQDRLSS